MKKTVSLLLAILMLAALAASAWANCIFPVGSGWESENVCTVKKANAGDVVKDGVIGENEYVRFEVDLGEDTSPLSLPYVTGEDLENAYAMLSTMEYYFSWDETHGINIAIRNKPHVIRQLLDVEDGEVAGDDFLHNTAYNISGVTDDADNPLFYYALGKRTDTGAYLEGYYNQLGAQGAYDPEEDVDYVIAYGDDGYATIEWSIPLNVFLKNGGGAGSTLQFSLTAMAGETTEKNDFSSFYGVGLGDFCYALDQKRAKNHVTYELSEETIAPQDPCTLNGHEPGEPEFISYIEEPTCTEDGIAAYDIHCTVCGELVASEEKTVPALGHDFGNNAEKCKRCGEPNPNYEPVEPVKFSDVADDAYYAEPVSWAVTKGVTQGIGSGKFGPDNGCTRGQVVTFLWRAAGEPKPKSDKNPFDDVKEGDYFYTAVLWAVENGITSGVSKTSFAPNSTCTRGQIVTFLWRANGEKAPKSANNPFEDVASGDYFYSAVLWAVENGVTSGVSKTSFAPGSTCTRAQVVTFLYRAMAK